MSLLSDAHIRAYLGGSFNPVHRGHIAMANAVYERLTAWACQHGIDNDISVALMPNARSPFKDKTAPPHHRLNMLKLAVKDTPLVIDELEIWQTPPVYTIDSVQKLHAQYPNDVLIFIMGMDSAAHVDKWKNGLDLIQYVHLWVFERGQYEDIHTQKARQRLPVALQKKVENNLDNLLLGVPHGLKLQQLGRIYIDTRPIAALSSTAIRHHMAKREFKAAKRLLDPSVFDYMMSHMLYLGS